MANNKADKKHPDYSGIVQLIRDRREEGLSQLYQNYSGAILHLILGIIPERSLDQEILQDTFVKIWEKIDLFDPDKGRLFTWMAQIARNTSLDKKRLAGYQNHRKTGSLDATVYDSETPGQEMSLADSGLADVLQRLDPIKGRLIELLYFQGYSQSEVAKKMDMPLGTVKTRARAGIVDLRKMLGNESDLLAFFVLTLEMIG